ncbi:MAG TPA: hypothetical protein ENN51_04420 [candidate division WOR-3 bacterium]|uniref:Uncharacterized protein n=1 Tax=candidate division WOR-3 bacterium TaxID=2052148 RepID=A0A7V0T5W0_UNCW3|nr:hypothetical protein [candidate division WOR-3 bacterium]
MRFWDKLLAVDRRWIYVVVWLVVMLPLLFPFAIRPVAMPPVEQLFNYIDTMPEDKALLISVDYTPDTEPELHPMTLALLRHAFANRTKVGVLCVGSVMSVGLGVNAVESVTEEFNQHATTNADSIIYGRDVVFWGWSTPFVTVLLGMGEKISNVFPVDYYGNTTEEMEITPHIRNYDDAGILVCLAASSIPLSWITYAQVQFGLPLGCGITAVSAADFYIYLNSGQFTGMLAGMKGAAEYEELVEQKMVAEGKDWGLRRRATEAMSSQTAAHLAIMLFIIVGNVAFFATRRRKQ